MPNVMPTTPCFFTQQLFLIGTCCEDGQPHFAPISWVSYTYGEPCCLIISMNGRKKTKDNAARTKRLSATVVTPDLLPFSEQVATAADKAALIHEAIEVIPGNVLDVPLIAGAKFSYECEILQTVELGDTTTYFAHIRQINLSSDVAALDWFDLNAINPVVYSPDHYFTVGRHLGKIGDFT